MEETQEVTIDEPAALSENTSKPERRKVPQGTIFAIIVSAPVIVLSSVLLFMGGALAVGLLFL